MKYLQYISFTHLSLYTLEEKGGEKESSPTSTIEGDEGEKGGSFVSPPTPFH